MVDNILESIHDLCEIALNCEVDEVEIVIDCLYHIKKLASDQETSDSIRSFIIKNK